MMAAALANALERARRDLEANEVASAATTIAAAASACTAAREAGRRLEPTALATLQELHARCASSFAEARARLARDLTTAGSARRAASAYRPIR